MDNHSMQHKDEPVQDLGFWLKQVNNAIEQKKNKDMAPMDITSSQMEVLFFLSSHEDETIHQIDVEKHLHCSNPTITGIVQRLEAKGYLERKSSEKDRRYKQLCLTEKSRQAFAAMDASRIAGEKNLMAGFSEEEKKQLLSYMKRIYHNIINEREEKDGRS